MKGLSSTITDYDRSNQWLEKLVDVSFLFFNKGRFLLSMAVGYGGYGLLIQFMLDLSRSFNSIMMPRPTQSGDHDKLFGLFLRYA